MSEDFPGVAELIRRARRREFWSIVACYVVVIVAAIMVAQVWLL